MARPISQISALVLVVLSVSTNAQSAPGETFLRTVPGMEEYRIRKTEVDDLGMTHTWADQYYAGVPVFGGEAIVHIMRDASLASIDEEAVLDLKSPAVAQVAPVEAVENAEWTVRCVYGAMSQERSTA